MGIWSFECAKCVVHGPMIIPHIMAANDLVMQGTRALIQYKDYILPV